MSCSFDGQNDVQRDEIRRARKEHRCRACRETIRVGDVYEYTFFLYEGEAGDCKRCLRCKAIYDELVRRHDGDWDEGVDYELNCGHSWDEVHGGEPPEHIARLAFMLPDEMQAELAPAAKAAE
jgi:hypothetical protein